MTEQLGRRTCLSRDISSRVVAGKVFLTLFMLLILKSTLWYFATPQHLSASYAFIYDLLKDQANKQTNKHPRICSVILLIQQHYGPGFLQIFHKNES